MDIAFIVSVICASCIAWHCRLPRRGSSMGWLRICTWPSGSTNCLLLYRSLESTVIRTERFCLPLVIVYYTLLLWEGFRILSWISKAFTPSWSLDLKYLSLHPHAGPCAYAWSVAFSLHRRLRSYGFESTRLEKSQSRNDNRSSTPKARWWITTPPATSLMRCTVRILSRLKN